MEGPTAARIGLEDARLEPLSLEIIGAGGMKENPSDLLALGVIRIDPTKEAASAALAPAVHPHHVDLVLGPLLGLCGIQLPAVALGVISPLGGDMHPRVCTDLREFLIVDQDADPLSL
jgi:hypothetical protein